MRSAALYGDRMSLFWPLPAGGEAGLGRGRAQSRLVHEFIAALVEGRRPAVDVYEAVAYTAPGIVAHQSALRDGETMKIPDFGRAG